MTRFYRTTIDELISILKDYNFTTTISDETSEYDTLEEMKTEVGSKIPHLEIEGYRERNVIPSIHLVLSSIDGTHIECFGRDDSLDSCWSRMCETLTSVKRPLHLKILRPKHGPAIIPIAVTLSLVAGYFNKQYQAILTGILILFALYSITAYRRYPVAILDRQHEHLSFWQNHREKIAYLIFGALVPELVRWISGK